MICGEVSGVKRRIIQELPNADFIIFLSLLDALMKHVIFPKIAIKLLTTATD
jgi:hypothetical protein